MRIVSSNEDFEKKRAAVDLRRALRQLAANVLRVIRGAGRPYQVGFDLAECVQAFHAYNDAFGHFPSDVTIAEALNPGKREREGDWDWPANGDEETAYRWARQRSRRDMRRAALQITASMLIGQTLQLDRGERDLDRAILRYEEASRDLEIHRASLQPAGKLKPRSRKPRKSIVL